MILAVTGITGHSGGFLLRQLIDHCFDGTLRCLVRESSITHALDESGLCVEKIMGSFQDPAVLDQLVSGADTIIHIAGIWQTPLLLQAVERVGCAGHVILVHTSGIYSKHKIASGVYKEIEESIQPFLDRGMNVTILRPTMIFGDIRDHNISKFIRMVDHFPFMPEIDHGQAFVQPVNARDLGQAYYRAAMHTSLPELSYICSGARPVSLHELCELISSFLGKKPHFISVPMGLGVFAAKVVKILSFGRKDLVEKVLRLGEDRSFPYTAAARDFGYEPEPFEIGLQREVKEYLSHGGR